MRAQVLLRQPEARQPGRLDLPVNLRQAVNENDAVHAGEHAQQRLEEPIERIDAAEFVHAADVVTPLGPLREVVALQHAEEPPHRRGNRRAPNQARGYLQADRGWHGGQRKDGKLQGGTSSPGYPRSGSASAGPPNVGDGGPATRWGSLVPPYGMVQSISAFPVPQISGLKITFAHRYATTLKASAAANKTWPNGSVNSRIVLSGSTK